jgi:hypothetical protein
MSCPERATARRMGSIGFQPVSGRSGVSRPVSASQRILVVFDRAVNKMTGWKPILHFFLEGRIMSQGCPSRKSMLKFSDIRNPDECTSDN